MLGSLRCVGQVSSGYIIQHMLSCHDDVVSCVDVSADGSLLATASWDATIKVFDRRGKAFSPLPSHSLYEHEMAVTVVRVHPRNEVLLSATVMGAFARRHHAPALSPSPLPPPPSAATTVPDPYAST